MRAQDAIVALAAGGLILCAVLVAGDSLTELGGLRMRVRHLAGALQAARPKREKPLSRTAQRQELVRQMPTFLDIVTLGLSAGLSFDASLELYCKRFDISLAHKVREALLSWRMGAASRDEALERLARESGSLAMRRFASTVSEALAFGTPLAETLERQAQVIRDEQRSEIEEEIERTPVKLLIPLGTLIVPAMLAAIFGPLLGPALGVA